MMISIPLKTAILSLLILFFSACSEQEQPQTRPELPPLQVNTISVKKEAVPIWNEYTGTTKANSEQEVRARVSGILEAVYFKDGQIVKKGDKLFKIEQSTYLSQFDAAQAKKAENEASLSLANADVARYMPLVKEGLAPRATLEQYQAKQAALKAAIAGDRAKINEAKLQLEYTIIKAPIDGRVSTRRVDVGNLVGQGEATLLTTIVNIDPIYAYFSPSQDDVRIFETYKNKDKPDAFVEVNGAMESVRLDGFIDFADNSVDTTTSTISMRATMKNSDAKILPGTFVYVNVFINDAFEFLMIPPEIIFSDQLGKFVYTVDANETIKRANIKTGYSTKFYVSVSEGLSDNDRVIVSSLVKLKPGLKVNATDTTEQDGITAILSKNNLFAKEK